MQFKKIVTAQDNNTQASITFNLYQNDYTHELMLSTFVSITPAIGETTGHHISISHNDWLLIKQHYGQPGTPIYHQLLTKYLTLFLIDTGKRMKNKKDREYFYQQYFKSYKLQ